ncbi:deoxyribonuclease IV [Candidatus Bathyarchaeota archaeon]|nr:MAG: deoxyribonuclease IV [Candidatus Bathyarchaeota archaeon]
MPLKVGMHVSIAGTIDLAVDRAVESNCDTFQIFTRNPRGWKVSNLDHEEVEKFKSKLRQHNIGPVVSHMPYLPNLSSPKDDFYEKSVEALVGEVERCTLLKIQYIVIHLGSHLGLGRDAGLKRLVGALNPATAKIKGDLKILLENTAGQANSMGSKFEELREIIDRSRHPKRLGVCLDTCLPPGSPVLAGGDVPVPIENVTTSDTVLGANGNPDRVIRSMRRAYSGSLIHIKPEGLPQFASTPEHPILCLKPKGWQYFESSPWRVRKVTAPWKSLLFIRATREITRRTSREIDRRNIFAKDLDRRPWNYIEGLCGVEHTNAILQTQLWSWSTSQENPGSNHASSCRVC